LRIVEAVLSWLRQPKESSDFASGRLNPPKPLTRASATPPTIAVSTFASP
jgi:hypothetical protein